MAAFRSIGHPICVDQRNLQRDDFSKVYLVIKLDCHREVPPTLFVRNRDDGLGAEVKLFVARYWFQPVDAPEPHNYSFMTTPLRGFTYDCTGPNWRNGRDSRDVHAPPPRDQQRGGYRHRLIAMGNCLCSLAPLRTYCWSNLSYCTLRVTAASLPVSRPRAVTARGSSL